MNEHYLYPGMLFADARPHRVTTVLGSCIAVCLFDPQRRIGGINHYMLPFWNGEGLPTPRYGDVAIDTLIDQLESLGCQGSRLEAKIFGGAAMWENGGGSTAVGERNIDLARRLLDRYRIPIVASDLSGCISRKLIYFTASGDVLLRRQMITSHTGAAARQLPETASTAC